MSDLIKKSEVLKKMQQLDWQDLYLPIHFKEFILDEVLTVDAEPLNHGHWIINADEESLKCSVCKESWSVGDYADDVKITAEDMKYCPSCGARMDKVVNE